MTSNFDAAFNKNDDDDVAAFYTEDAIWKTPHGTFTGRQAIEKDYDHEFRQYHSNNLSTKFDQVNAVGNDVRAMGSELDECALGADLRVIDSTFYFS